jgi:hypothetical protein
MEGKYYLHTFAFHKIEITGFSNRDRITDSARRDASGSRAGRQTAEKPRCPPANRQ